MKTWLVALIVFTAVMVIGFSCGREEKKIIDPPKVLTDHENLVAARDLLKQGMDVHLTASGRDKKVLTFKYIFVSRPFVYQMSTSSDVINNLKNLGFEKVIFTDGYNSSWSMDVK